MLYTTMADYDASAPLLTRLRGESDQTSILQSWNETQAGFLSFIRDLRARGRHMLASPSQHYTLMVFVALDVTLLLLNVFLRLISCETHQNDEEWVEDISLGLEVTGVIFSYLFALELVACVFSFGSV
jgi:voltage-gated hydrogen channel 1